MPIRLSAPIIKTFALEKTDNRYENDSDSPTTVTIRQATQAQHEHRQSIFATLERRYDDYKPDQTTLVQTANMEELKRLEVWLTLVESNITKEDGKQPLFPSRKGSDGAPELSMLKSEFDLAWGMLPPDVASEIHEKVLEVNFMWGPRG